ncbi:MAG: hypothetical protein DWQ36_12705 [Acidobacteria bacterium]|nr:MAG: hypothetical protein DWQ36_12705 [Acidobacteriota bacterium]
MLAIGLMALGHGVVPGAAAAQQVDESGPVITAEQERGDAKRYWLVTHDGQQIEASGPWQVRGRQLLYPNLAGDLVSIPLSEVDLEASELATNPPPPPEVEPGPPPAPVLVLRTNEQPELATSPPAAGDASAAPEGGAPAGGDQAEGADGDQQSGAGETGETGDGSGSASAEGSGDASAQPSAERPRRLPVRRSSAVEVVSWRDISPEFDSATIYGTVRNTSDVTVTSIRMQVIALDETGADIQRQPAVLLASRLDPGETTNFRSVFAQIGAHSDFRFEIEATR